jgi:hypothetical protein
MVGIKRIWVKMGISRIISNESQGGIVMSIKKSVKLLCGILIFLGFSTLLFDFSSETHKAITEKAVHNSILNDYIKSYLSRLRLIAPIKLEYENITK